MPVMAAVARLLALISVLGLLAAGCGGRQHTEAGGAALLEFSGSPVSDAEVWIDGQYHVGALRRGIKIKPGAHRLEIRHDDYHTQYLELTVVAGETRTVPVLLAEILP